MLLICVITQFHILGEELKRNKSKLVSKESTQDSGEESLPHKGSL